MLYGQHLLVNCLSSTTQTNCELRERQISKHNATDICCVFIHLLCSGSVYLVGCDIFVVVHSRVKLPSTELPPPTPRDGTSPNTSERGTCKLGTVNKEGLFNLKKWAVYGRSNILSHHGDITRCEKWKVSICFSKIDLNSPYIWRSGWAPNISMNGAFFSTWVFLYHHFRYLDEHIQYRAPCKSCHL